MLRRVKRSLYASFWVEDSPVFDVSEFLRGRIKASSKRPQLLAVSPFAATRLPVTPQEVGLLAELPADSWSAAVGLDIASTRLEVLARHGLLVSDSDETDLARLRRHHDLLAAQQWHPYAAFYHFMTREREQNTGVPSAPNPDTEHLAASADEDTARFIDRYGPPPSPFHRSSNVSQVIDLPQADRSGGFYDVLCRRRSVRAFDTSKPMKLGDFTALLQYSFGCYGYSRLSPELVTLHRTSPSGGALQPIEAYLLVLSVETLAPGFYHYDMKNHALELIQRCELDEGRDLAVEICGGQSHARSAHVMVVMTARFLRNFWKYRQRSLAYGSLLMEVGHFSQTLQLVATELGLGIFFAPIGDAPKVEEILGLVPEEEGPLAICGCGVKVAEGSDLGLDFQEFVPGKTTV